VDEMIVGHDPRNRATDGDGKRDDVTSPPLDIDEVFSGLNPREAIGLDCTPAATAPAAIDVQAPPADPGPVPMRDLSVPPEVSKPRMCELPPELESDFCPVPSEPGPFDGVPLRMGESSRSGSGGVPLSHARRALMES
jgi:hypothetical protein